LDPGVEVEIFGERLEVSSRVDDLVIKPLTKILEQTVGYLSPPACARFLTIYDAELAGRTYVVPGDFVRHSDEHRQYRELRHSLMIRPRTGGQWDPGKEVEVCEISHLMYRQHRAIIHAKAETVGGG
jgi:hypothetical protein